MEGPSPALLRSGLGQRLKRVKNRKAARCPLPPTVVLYHPSTSWLPVVCSSHELCPLSQVTHGSGDSAPCLSAHLPAGRGGSQQHEAYEPRLEVDGWLQHEGLPGIEVLIHIHGYNTPVQFAAQVGLP